MKKLGKIIRWMAVFILATQVHVALSQTGNASPAKSDAAATTGTNDDQVMAKALAELLKTYKAEMDAISANLKETDGEPAANPKTAQTQNPTTDSPAKAATAGNAEADHSPLRTGHLVIGHVQPGSLPLTLPDVLPTQRSAIEYEGTMFQKAIYEKALTDRYKFFHDLNSKVAAAVIVRPAGCIERPSSAT